MVSDEIQKIGQRAEPAKLTKLLQLRSIVTGRKDQGTRIKISAFLRERMFSKKLKKILDNIYCEHCHTIFATYIPMAYVTNFNGSLTSLLINGCSIKPETTNYLKCPYNLVNL